MGFPGNGKTAWLRPCLHCVVVEGDGGSQRSGGGGRGGGGGGRVDGKEKERGLVVKELVFLKVKSICLLRMYCRGVHRLFQRRFPTQDFSKEAHI